MKKQSLSLLIAMVIALTLPINLIGCSSNNDNQDASSTEQEQTQETDKEKAQIAIDAINAIGEVTLDSKNLLKKARDAYHGLSTAQKELVDNYDVLVADEETFSNLVNAAKTLTIGETVEDKDFRVTLTNAEISSTLESSKSSTYWQADDNSTFVILEFDVEALNSEHIPVDYGAITNLVATFNGNTYKGWNYRYITSQLWIPVLRTYFEANMPEHIYVYASIPSTATAGSVTVDMEVAGQEKQLTL